MGSGDPRSEAGLGKPTGRLGLAMPSGMPRPATPPGRDPRRSEVASTSMVSLGVPSRPGVVPATGATTRVRSMGATRGGDAAADAGPTGAAGVPALSLVGGVSLGVAAGRGPDAPVPLPPSPGAISGGGGEGSGPVRVVKGHNGAGREQTHTLHAQTPHGQGI
jgi:hypothetical protein